MKRHKLFSIAPDVPFLPTLAASILDGSLLPDWPRTGPFWLSDITIYVPTKRARLALIDHLLALSGGSQLLPNIFTLGEGDEAENAFFTDPDVESLDVTSKLYRTTALSSLIAKWAATAQANGQPGFSSPPSMVEILAMAQSLGGLIDDFLTEEIDFTSINNLVPEDLAANWQETLQFLDIAFQAWPAHVQDLGQIDSARLRQQRFDLAGQTLALRYDDRPVIAAGSTGSVPATSRFLKAISQLENGAVVLPGLDMAMTPDEHGHLIDKRNKCHAHPQYGLAHLLRNLGATPANVNELGNTKLGARANILHATLARPERTSHWHQIRADMEPEEVAHALDGMSILALDNLDHEARAIAIAAREAVEHGHKVGVISPDRDLARRIKVELERFNIIIDDSAGMPLTHSPAGRLLRQLLAALKSNFKPVDLIALFANRNFTLGYDRAEVSRMREMLDLSVLRGARGLNGIAGIKQLIRKNVAGEMDRTPRRLSADEGDQLSTLLDKLESACRVICDENGPKWDLAALSRNIPTLIEHISSTVTGQNAQLLGHQELLQWASELTQTSRFTSSTSPHDIIASINLLMQNVTVRPPETTRQDVQIWGRIEARLLDADLMILAGLNEGVWPEIAEPGPWLSRGMKLAIELDPPERKVGLAAHDFLMAAGSEKTLITYAKRRGSSPADVSRFIQRFEAFIGEKQTKKLYQKSKYLRELVVPLDMATEAHSSIRPAPTPTADVRPNKLSITEVETLIRDPYAIYAKHVLGLRKLRPLGAAPDAAERGDLIHDVLGKFVEGGHDFMAPEAHDVLMKLAREVYSRLDDVEDRRDIWLRRFATIAEHVVAYERERNDTVKQRFAERFGNVSLPIGSNDFTLFGFADRVDILKDETAELIDFKTGSIPQAKQMREFFSPQLPMEAVISKHHGFKDVPAANASALTYVKLSHGPSPFEAIDFKSNKDGLEALIDDYWRHFSSFADVMLNNDRTAMAAQLMPKPDQRFAGDYDHFARQKEWMIDQGDEE